jgi:deoxyribodipyrimidine photolyase
MILQNRILYWFREDLSINGNKALHAALTQCDVLIPVYCFDPREFTCLHHKGRSESSIIDLIDRVSYLRQNLQKSGSNLLVVNDHIEKIIPSLARVLNVSSVVADYYNEGTTMSSDPIALFRNQKAMEVMNLLRMHSIPVNFISQGPAEIPHHYSVPNFPEINVGDIPSVQQILDKSA